MWAMVHPEEMTPIQRGGVVTYHLMLGEALDAEKVRELVGYSRLRDAERLLERLAERLPFYEAENGHWEVCAMQEAR